jgi:hypothetical protein
MDYMTKIDGVPSTDQVKPGMAFFADTGPFGKTCGDCKFRGYHRQREIWSEDQQTFVTKAYRVQKCEMFRKMAGRHGPDVDKDYLACKFFEEKEKKKSAQPAVALPLHKQASP